ncbi:MAG: hypothetical protein FJY82_00025 [Candidatus Aminicenantes bacterium]|nr:hypothetical protein [Candidatus Aminicenantes bacterium]
MAKCVFEDRIGAYLKGELPPEEEARFEEHYFNCPACFRETAERSDLEEALRSAGEAAFRARPQVRLRPGWVYAAAAAVAAAAVILSLPSSPPKPSPFQFPADEIVRGPELAVVGPAGTLAAPPEGLEWRPVAGAAVYRLALTFEGEAIWTAETADQTIALPAEVRSRLVEGRTYVWRVRAYAAEGRRIGVSEPTAFRVGR